MWASRIGAAAARAGMAANVHQANNNNNNEDDAGGGYGGGEGAGGSGGGEEDDEEDESIRLAGSLRDQKSSAYLAPGRATFGPFGGRSQTPKSGSLQDLKVSPVAGGGGGSLSRKLKQVQTFASVQQREAPDRLRPKLERQRSSQVSSSSNALSSPSPNVTSTTATPGHPHRQQRNPFRSSKSMLLLAQNQHIPQATAQLDCFMSKQQADFINYANYQRQQHRSDWPPSNATLNQSNSGSDQMHLSQGSNQSICQQQQQHQLHKNQLNSSSSSYDARAAHQYNQTMSSHHHRQQQHQQVADSSSSANAMSSEQCNEQDNEDSPNCMQIMKKLFFSLVLGTIVAICWVMIIHTLKWIAIRGNEFELWQLQLQQQQQLLLQAHTQLQPPSANYNSPDNIHQANLLLAHQSIQVAKQQQQQTSSNTTTAKSNNTMRTAEGVSNETAATSARPQLYQGDQEEADTGLVGQRRRRRRRGHRMSNNDTQASGRDDDEIKEALDRRTRRALLGQPAPTRASHEQFGRQAKRDNDASHSTAVVPFASMITGGRQQQLPGANRRIKQSTAQGDDDAGGQLPSLVGESGRIEELPQRRRLMQLSSISHEQVPRTNSNSNNNDKPVAADQYRQRPTAGLANQQSAGMRVLAEMGDENDELDSSGNDLTTILPLGPQNQPMNNGALDQSAAASATMSILPTSPASGDPDQSAPQHLSSAIERSPAPVDGQVGEAQVLVYKAPFFTSWFVSIWNIAFMPVFTIISSCCFRNEESTTKKLLAESISQFMDNGLTTLQFLGRCAFFSLLWIGTIFGIVYSLAYLDATVVMALFACSVALVYLLSWVLLHQQFVGVRIVAVIICTTGIALLAYMDNSKTLGSVLIVAGSALCSAVYKVIYQRMFGFWSIAQMSLFFTLIGLFNAFLMWPVALLLYFLGVELIAWRHIPWFHLIAAGALHLTANIVAYFGPICSYDIFLTLGLMFAVVLSAVIDVTFYKITFSGMKLAGVVLLMIGFLVCLLPENWNECLYDLANERFIRWKKQRSLKKSRNKVQDMSTGQMSRLRTPSGRVK
uniref:Solute carrier family 35 member F4 n=1 Tax=Aceria tosichella TaxID=561515 RepID=A0A6G1S3Y8_9ACAR